MALTHPATQELAPIAPHGGPLVCRLAGGEAGEAAAARAAQRPALELSPRQLGDLEMIAVGGYSPLEGFLGRDDYESVLRSLRLADGLPWPLPITLAVDAADAARCRRGSDVALCDAEGPLALLEVSEVYGYDKGLEAELVYQTRDPAHPGVAALFAQGERLVGGRVTVFRLPRSEAPAELRLSPAQTRFAFAQRGWRRVVGFQTRNPIHRAHEYLQRCALEVCDGLLIHPLVGETKPDDLPVEVRLRCYQVVVGRYFPRERVLLSVLPAPMRYAGPREALLHALVRKNYGCTHFIVGRDHAGVGAYYGPHDAQRIFDRFAPEEIGITPLFFEHAFYCRACGGMATAKTCPHERGERVTLSGTALRELLGRGEAPPEEFTRPEVAAVLLEAAGGAGRPPSSTGVLR